jgi:uncharacterized protein with PIN domain
MTRFLLDVMLGKLATYLRMCGHDAAYALDRSVESDEALRSWARAEGRTLLTRDIELAEQTPDAILLGSRAVRDQLGELAAGGLDLDLADPPERCSRCNGALTAVDRAEPTPTYAPDTTERPVWRCEACGQHFWRGSHWGDVADTLTLIRNADVTPPPTHDR